MEKKSLYIIAAIAVIAVIGLFSFTNLTGRGTENTILGNCMDSDGGDDPYFPGSASFSVSKEVYKDECYSEGTIYTNTHLKERICMDKMETIQYLCESGCLENENGEGYCKEGEAVRR